MFHRKSRASGEEKRWPAGQKIFLGQPTNYPQALVDGLKDYFSAHREVEAPYLAQVFVPVNGEPPHPVIGIRLRHGFGGSLPPALADLGAIVKRTSGAGTPVDFVEIGPTEVSKYLVEQTKPFYSAVA